jgi:hypothetical protein
VCCVLIGVSPYLVPLPPGDDPIAVTVIIIITFSFLLQENYFALSLGAPSLTTGRVCNL